MSFQELNSKEDFEGAIKNPSQFVFVFVYDSEIPASAKERLAANVDRFPQVAPPFAFDITKAEQARNHLKIVKTPTILIYKGGKEVTRVEEPNPDKMKEIEGLFSGVA